MINWLVCFLLYLLNDILDSVKFDKGKFEFEYIDFMLSEEIDMVIFIFWFEVKCKGFDLCVDLFGKLVKVYNGVLEWVC